MEDRHVLEETAAGSFRILGPVQVWNRERQVALGGPRQLTLLAALLLHANRAVSVDVLSASIWRDERPRGNRLPMAITRLRQALAPLDGDDEPALRTVSGGYMLAVPASGLDASVFQSLIQEGRQALERDELALAADRLRAALALWRGPPLAEVYFEDFAQPEIRRLEELRLTAVESWIDAELGLGRHDALIAELEALVAEHPTRERITGQLMLALYRSGRQVDALDVFQRARTALAHELGLEPGELLRALQQQILSSDPALSTPGAGQGPSPMPARDLPAARTSFVGREAEIAAISDHLGVCQLVTLTGMGGVGKTRLALELAQRTVDDWPDGVRLVELDSIRNPAAVVDAVASALGLAPVRYEATVRAIATRLQERRLLLVLDNCEHVLDPIGSIARAFMRADSHSRVLATSRMPIGVAGEHLVQLLPMPVPDAAAGDDTLVEFESVRLFVDRAQQACRGLVLAGRELRAVGELCAMLDGLPLPIELAAVRVRAMAPTEIKARLRSRLALASRGGGVDARHRDLETTIKWSYDLLSLDDQDVFRRIAVFPAPFTLSAAERTVAGPRVADAIVALVDSSMLVVDDRSEVTRYRMLDTVREFGLQRLAGAGETADTGRSYLRWAVEFVDAASEAAETHEHAAALRRVVVEQRNLVGALSTTELVDERLRLAADLAALLAAGTGLREVRRMLEGVLASAGEMNTADFRRAAYWLGYARRKLGDLDAARDQLVATVAHAAQAGDRDMAGLVTAEQALLEIRANRYDEAQRRLDSVESEESLDPRVMSYRLLARAQVHWAFDQLHDARRLYDASIALSRRHGRVAHLIIALAALAELAAELDDIATAERCAREVLAISEPTAEAYPRTGAAFGLGLMALRAHRPAEAASWLAEGAASHIERGSVETAMVIEALACAVAAGGDAVNAAIFIGAASTLRERSGVEPIRGEQAYIDTAMTRVAETLTESELEHCLTEGRHLHELDLLKLVNASSMGSKSH